MQLIPEDGLPARTRVQYADHTMPYQSMQTRLFLHSPIFPTTNYHRPFPISSQLRVQSAKMSMEAILHN